MAKAWHQRHISTKWGVTILLILLLGLIIAIPSLSKTQNLFGRAYYDDSMNPQKVESSKKACAGRLSDRKYNGYCYEAHEKCPAGLARAKHEESSECPWNFWTKESCCVGYFTDGHDCNSKTAKRDCPKGSFCANGFCKYPRNLERGKKGACATLGRGAKCLSSSNDQPIFCDGEFKDGYCPASKVCCRPYPADFCSQENHLCLFENTNYRGESLKIDLKEYKDKDPEIPHPLPPDWIDRVSSFINSSDYLVKMCYRYDCTKDPFRTGLNITSLDVRRGSNTFSLGTINRIWNDQIRAIKVYPPRP